MSPKKAIITLSVLLGLSVCANAFLGGMVLSQGPFRGPPPMFAGDFSGESGSRGHMREGARQFTRSLPPEVRQPVMEAFRNDHDQREELISNIASARRAAMDILKAEPFDVVKLREALAVQRQAQGVTQAHVHELLVGVIEKLTPEQRQQLARASERIFK